MHFHKLYLKIKFNKDMHDKKVIHMFNKVYIELVDRIQVIESE